MQVTERLLGGCRNTSSVPREKVENLGVESRSVARRGCVGRVYHRRSFAMEFQTCAALTNACARFMQVLYFICKAERQSFPCSCRTPNHR